jgi:hypothetical protein
MSRGVDGSQQRRPYRGELFCVEPQGGPCHFMNKVASRDGTTIAFEQSGEGPPVILV